MLVVIFRGYRIVQDRLFESDFDKVVKWIEASRKKGEDALNFAYVLFLNLKEIRMEDALIERYVRRWLVMSILLGRYSGSPESKFDSDIREINESGIEHVLQDVETAYLSDSFWDSGLIQRLTTAGSSAPALHVFWAAQAKFNDKGFLSRDISVKEMIEHRGDIHHIFLRQYLKENGFSQSQYNQVANYVYVQQEINIKVGKRSPADYIGQIREQCQSGKLAFGGIDNSSCIQYGSAVLNASSH